MYPDLSYLFHDLFGTQTDNWLSIFKTFGFMLVTAVLTAAWVLAKELKRKELQGLIPPRKVKQTIGLGANPVEVAGNALYGFLLGFKGAYIIQNFQKFQTDPVAGIFSLDGNYPAGILLAALFGGFFYWSKNKEKLPQPKTIIVNEYPHQKVGDIAIIAAITGVLGAKLFANFESAEAMHQFFSDPIGTFFTGSGLAIYGGLIMGFFGCWWYIRKINLDFWQFFDAAAPAFIFAMAVGRIGCQLAGDGDWGIAAAPMPHWWFLPDWLWSYDYPQNVNNAGVLMDHCNAEEFRKLMGEKMSWEQRCQLSCGVNYCHQLDPKVYPTPIYETIMFTIMGGFVLHLARKITIPGILFFISLIFLGIERYLIESIRVNDKINFLGGQWTQAEIISIILIIIGTVGAISFRQKAKKQESN